MDYVSPVEAVIPGVQGKVLAVLARSDTEMSMRAVGRLAGVSAQQSSLVLGQLIDLGIVERRDVPPVGLVRLGPDNLAAQMVIALARLHQAALGRLAELATSITPAPASLVIFGSFARGQAGPGSDLDILAVRPAGLAGDHDRWTDSLGVWADTARRLVGNSVNLIEVESSSFEFLTPHAKGCSPRGPMQMPSTNGSAPRASRAQSERWTCARAAERAST